jgi:hypothetical protein
VQQAQGTAAARFAFNVSKETGLLMSWCCLSAACNLRMQLALHTIMPEEHTHLVQPGLQCFSHAVETGRRPPTHQSWLQPAAACAGTQCSSTELSGPQSSMQGRVRAVATGWYARRIMQASKACDQVSSSASRLTHTVVLLCLLCLPTGWQDRVPRVWCGYR